MTNIISQAQAYAALTHKNQKRNYTGVPYFEHLEEVAQLCASVGERPVVIAAAYLHDVIEDTDTTRDELVRHFGAEVGWLVWEVTDQSKPENGNRAARKAIEREHLARASRDGKTIKLADLISNSKHIAKYDSDFAVIYMKEKRLLLPHLVEGNAILFACAEEILLDYENGTR